LSTNYYAVKALKKDMLIQSGWVGGAFMEKEVMNLGSSCPFIIHLHSTFTNNVRARQWSTSVSWSSPI